MSKIKVLLVDDTSIIRKCTKKILEEDPNIETMGSGAANGQMALDMMEKELPDVVLLDIEMPVLDGMQTLIEIRKKWPKLPVIMFSTLTQKGAYQTIEALGKGANDFVGKPSSLDGESGLEDVKGTLTSKIRIFAKHSVGNEQTHKNNDELDRNTMVKINKMLKRVDILAIGSSTGGPNALADIFAKLPEDFPVPIVISQHMPQYFTKVLAERLDKVSKLSVEEGKDGSKLEVGKVYIAPGDFHLVITKDKTISLNQNDKENSCRPAVDPMFRSCAEVYKDKVLSVILTGMGKDGFQGSRFIKEHGGIVITQDEPSSVVYSMPRWPIDEGITDLQLSLNSLPQGIVNLVYNGRFLSKKLVA